MFSTTNQASNCKSKTSKQKIKGSIESIAFGGDGILRLDDFVTFVPYSAPGDFVQIEITQKKKNFQRGKLEKILKPAPSRTLPICPHFTKCGGCQFQHLTYEAELLYKQQFLTDSLRKIGKLLLNPLPIIPSPKEWAYRKHITLKLLPYKDTFKPAFDTFIPSHCHLFEGSIPHLSLASKGIEKATMRLFNNLQAYTFYPHLPNNHHILKNASQTTLLKSPNKTVVYGPPLQSISLLDLTIYPSPYGFLQSNWAQFENICKALLALVSSNQKRVLDLYSGVGIYSLLLAKNGHQTLGLEISPEAVKTAKENTMKNNLSCKFLACKVEEKLPYLLPHFKPELIIINPPRTGLNPSLIPLLNQTKVPLIYLSCNPATLSRDLALLTHTATYIQPFDMFPKTTHLETLTYLTP